MIRFISAILFCIVFVACSPRTTNTDPMYTASFVMNQGDQREFVDYMQERSSVCEVNARYARQNLPVSSTVILIRFCVGVDLIVYNDFKDGVIQRNNFTVTSARPVNVDEPSIGAIISAFRELELAVNRFGGEGINFNEGCDPHD